MRNKKIKRTIRIAVCVVALMLFVAFTQEISAQQRDDLMISSDGLAIILDVELPSFVGKKFEVIFSAATKAETMTIIMYFDGFVNRSVWERTTTEFFFNKKAIIDCVDAGIIAGIAHEFEILATDSNGESKTITKMMTVDFVDPIFSSASLEHISEDGQVTKVEDDAPDPVAMKEGESLRLNWTVLDENFVRVRYYIDEWNDETNYDASISLLIGWKRFEIDDDGVTEQTYSLKIVAMDKAKNTKTLAWLVKYSQPLDPVIDQEEHDRELAEAQKEKEEQIKATRNGVLFGSIFFGLFGAIAAVFSAKASRDNLKGYAGRRDKEGLVTIKDREKYYHYEKPRHRFSIRQSKFGRIFFTTLIVIGVLSVIALALALFVHPTDVTRTYFWAYLAKTSLASLLLFFIVIFVISFQFLIKGDFEDIFTNKTEEEKNTSAGWLISFFEEGDKRRLITDNFVDACNDDYFDLNFSDKGRMSYNLHTCGDTTKTMYIPAKDIKITKKDGIEIESFEIVGHKHVQEVLDGESEEDRKAAQELSNINEGLATELTAANSTLRELKNNIKVLASRGTAKELATLSVQEAAVNKYVDVESIKTAKEIEEEAKKKLEEEKANVSQ